MPKTASTAADPAGADPRLFILSMQKGMAVLEAFDSEHPTMTLQELTERTGLGRSATQRFVHTLDVLGYLVRDPKTLRYRLSNRAFLFVRSILSANSALEQSFHLLSQLAEQTGETASWLERDGDAAVVVATVPSPHRSATVLPIGTRLDLASSSAGLFLADIATLDPISAERASQARQTGWAISDSDLDRGSLTVAAPVRDIRGRIIAAINISVLRDRTSLQETHDRIVPLLVDVSTAASKMSLG